MLLILYGPADPVALLLVVVLWDFGHKAAAPPLKCFDNSYRQVLTRHVFSILWFAMQENKQWIKIFEKKKQLSSVYVHYVFATQ